MNELWQERQEKGLSELLLTFTTIGIIVRKIVIGVVIFIIVSILTFNIAVTIASARAISSVRVAL
jgi:hypothetical protein